MTIKAHLAELEREHKVIEDELAEALAHSSFRRFEDRRVEAPKVDTKG